MGSFIWKGTAILGSKCGGSMGRLGVQKFIPQVLTRDQMDQRVLLGCSNFFSPRHEMDALLRCRRHQRLFTGDHCPTVKISMVGSRFG